MSGAPVDRQPPITETLIDVDDSVLIVIDIQDYFLRKFDAAISRASSPLMPEA